MNPLDQRTRTPADPVTRRPRIPGRPGELASARPGELGPGRSPETRAGCGRMRVSPGLRAAPDGLPVPPSAASRDRPFQPDALDGLTRLEAAVAPLRGRMPTGELLRTAADAVTGLGFDRALVSSVHDGCWVPRWVSDPKDPAWGERILEAGRADRRPLGGRLAGSGREAGRSPIMVRDARRDPWVHDELALCSLAASYVVVPLVCGGGVIGLLHADCYYQRREPDQLACRLLRLYADVLAQALLRATALDRLDIIGSELTRLSGCLPGIRPGASRPAPLGPLMTPGPPRTGPREVLGREKPVRVPDRYRLTKRQVEVIELVAEGHTNAVIGSRLYITQDTVKSHVKLLLRKFNAGNRAELVSRWLSIVNQ